MKLLFIFSLLLLYASCHILPSPYKGMKITVDSLYFDSITNYDGIKIPSALITIRTNKDLKKIIDKTGALRIIFICPLDYDVNYFENNFSNLIDSNRLGNRIEFSVESDKKSIKTKEEKQFYKNGQFYNIVSINVMDNEYHSIDSTKFYIIQYFKTKEYIGCMSYLTYFPLTSFYQQDHSDTFSISKSHLSQLIQ